MKIKKLIYIFAAGIIFAGCSNLIDDSSIQELFQDAASQNEGSLNGTLNNDSLNNGTTSSDSAKGAVLKISIDDGSSARTAMPAYSKNDLIYLTLRYSEKYGDSADTSTASEVCVGDWKSETEMSGSTLSFMTGTYTFRFYVVAKGGAVFGDEQTVTIKNGVNTLSFSPTMEYFLTEYPGKGNLSINMYYNTKNVAKVTAGLYTTEGEEVPGFNDEALTDQTGSGYVKYEKTGIPSGNYIVIFKFYADNDLLLGTYREYASIVNELTSTSDCRLTSLGNLFNINYELNGGNFVTTIKDTNGNDIPNPYKPPVSYTSQSSIIDLPPSNQVTKTGYDFGGWYTSPDFSGNQMTLIPAGSTGSLTLYARWIPKVTVIFSPNGGSITTLKQTDSPDTDGFITLKTKVELGLNPPKIGQAFKGWSYSPDYSNSLPETTEPASELTIETDSTSGQSIRRFKDGAKIKAEGTIVLYAIWTKSQINPIADDENAELSRLDFDGDGLTNWEEVYKYHTDPTSIDTDGDGWTDKQEISLYNKNTKYFSPLIADTPYLDVVIADKPTIQYIYKTSETHTDTETQSITEGTIGSRATTATNTKTFNMTHGWNVHITGHYSASHKTTAGQNNSTEDTTTKGVDYGAGVSGSYSSGDTFTFSRTDTESWSKSWQHGKNISVSKGKTLEGGKIIIPVKLKNQTQVGYTIKSYTLAVNKLAYGKPYEKAPVGQYTSTAPMTLRPESESGIINITLTLTVKETEELLKYSNTIFVELSGFQVTTFKDSQTGNNDFTEALTEVRAKTASLYIDCGPASSRKPRTYNVSVKNRLNENNTGLNDQYQPVKLKEILDNILELKENYKDENGAYTSAGYEISTAAGKGKDLKSLYGISNGSSQKDGNWYISRIHNENGIVKENIYAHWFNKTVNTSWDLEDIEVSAGDEIMIFYSVDRDEDDLPLVKELVYGTSDTKWDTDGDSLSDYDEIYGWYKPGLEKEKYMIEAGHHEYAPANGDNREYMVYSNPTLKDTDGDGENDYSATGLADKDPINPYQKNNKSLKPLAYYMTSLTGEKHQLKLPTEGSPEGTAEENIKTQENTITVYEDSIFFDISASNPYTKVEYLGKVTRDSVTTEEWIELAKTTEHKLIIGENNIKLRSWDALYVPTGENDPDLYYYWNIKVTSNLREFSGLEAVAESNKNGEVRITWNSYTDLRCNSSDGGYVLYGVKSETEPTNFAYIARSKLTQAPSDKTNLDTKDDFVIKLKEEEMKTNVGITLQLAPQKKYWFYLYGYAHAGETTTYHQQCLGKTSVTTPKSTKAILCFYAHYIEDLEDCDGSSDPNYYWTFDCNNSSLDFSKCNLKRELTTDFDVDDEGEAKYCTLGGNSFGYHDYKWTPTKFGNETRKIMAEFERDKDHNFTVTWQANEKDNGSDDYLGTVTATFSYSSSLDRWTCTASSGSLLTAMYGGGEIKAGDKTNYEGIKAWYIGNSDYGSLKFVWDWSWDYESKDSMNENQGK